MTIVLYYILTVFFAFIYIYVVEKKLKNKPSILKEIKTNINPLLILSYSLMFTFLMLFIYYLLDYLNILIIIPTTNFNIFTSFITVIISPLVEEYTFRYLPYKLFPKNDNKYLIMFISTMLFTMFHNINKIEYILVFISGLLLTIIYFKTKSILYPLICHISYNTILTFLTLINIGTTIKTLILLFFMFIIGLLIKILYKKLKI